MTQEMPPYRPRYLDSLHWVAKPEYWAMHVYSYCCLKYGSCLEDEAIFGAFGLRAENVWSFHDQEFASSTAEEDHYPCHRIALPLPRGSSVAMEYHQFPEDAGMQYRLYRLNQQGILEGGYDPDQLYQPDDPFQFGGYDGQSWNPKISWAELVLISDSIQQVAQDTILGAVALPLFFPAVLLDSGDELGEVRRYLRQSWMMLDVLHGDDVETVVDGMLAENQGLGEFLRHDVRTYTPPTRRFEFLLDVNCKPDQST
jgi:hypothetical protein